MPSLETPTPRQPDYHARLLNKANDIEAVLGEDHDTHLLRRLHLKHSVLCDAEIAYMAHHCRMIEPFHVPDFNEPDKPPVSSGLTSFGYDLRVKHGSARLIGQSSGAKPLCVGPLHPPETFDRLCTPLPTHDRSYEINGNKLSFDGFYVPPHSVVLAASMEYIRMPENVVGISLGKSTYARYGVNVLITPLEPGWEGELTLEIHNATANQVYVLYEHGVTQVCFFAGLRPAVTYSDRKGKYQGQLGTTLPRQG